MWFNQGHLTKFLPRNKEIILSGKVSEYDIEETAVKHGMITMLQDGLLKVLAGITSIKEVLRQVE